MGRTVPSFRIAAEMKRSKWKLFRQRLDKKDRKEFDEYSSAGSNACRKLIHPILMSIMFKHYKQLKKIETTKKSKKPVRIMIIEHDEDILTLFNDYLCLKGHHLVSKYLSADSIMSDIEKDMPDVYLIDYRLPGNKNGIDVAIEILNKFPEAPILFITAHESLHSEISKLPEFHHKNVEFLTKPVKLYRMETTMLNLVNKK